MNRRSAVDTFARRANGILGAQQGSHLMVWQSGSQAERSAGALAGTGNIHARILDWADHWPNRVTAYPNTPVRMVHARCARTQL